MEPFEVFVSAAKAAGPLPEVIQGQGSPPLPRSHVGGQGKVQHPPDAVERVRREIAGCSDPARRRELEAVLADLEQGE